MSCHWISGMIRGRIVTLFCIGVPNLWILTHTFECDHAVHRWRWPLKRGVIPVKKSLQPGEWGGAGGGGEEHHLS